METNLSLFTIKMYLEDNMFATTFKVIAKTENDAITYITKFIESNVTDLFNIKEIYKESLMEGKIIYA